jgi:MFS family permease
VEGDRQQARDTRLIVGAVGISALGDFLLWVPLTLHLQATTDSAIAVAALMFALWGPIVLLAPLAGLVVDRGESRSILIVASLAQALVVAALALAVDSLAATLALATLLGVGFAFAQPAEFTLVPVIAGERRLTEVNGYVETARYIGMMAGPLIGGALAATGSIELALLVNSATFVVVVLAGLLLGARCPAGSEDEVPMRARDGAVFLFRDRTLAIVLAVVFVSLLFMSASVTAEVFFLKQDLEVGDVLYGVIFATWVTGMVAGALLVARRIPQSALAAAALVAVAVQGLGLGGPTIWVVAGFAAGAWFIGGVGHGTKNVLARSLIQERVPTHLHGRAFAAYNGMRNGAELFALAAGGLLVAVIGARVTLALAGAIPVFAALAGFALYRRGQPTEVSSTSWATTASNPPLE